MIMKLAIKLLISRVITLNKMLALFFVLMISGCVQQEETPTIHYVIPQGFEGVFLIYEDKLNGQSTQIIDNQLTLYVNDNGKLPVVSLAYMSRLHRWRCRFNDGAEISIDNADKFSLYNLGYIQDVGKYYLIGNAAQYIKVRGKFPFETPPLGQTINLDSCD
ncbi:MAG: hypothetical protein COC21_04975 [Verrucomicrobiales bacterium]|nr:MAG: hypothetical protein COC21_04975 [Verrucomicrobiales bacterium]